MIYDAERTDDGICLSLALKCWCHAAAVICYILCYTLLCYAMLLML